MTAPPPDPGGPLRLMVYDRTCVKYGVGLSTAWGAGATLYRGLRRHDASFGATSWAEALAWLGAIEPDRPIAEIQYWGHGKWGCVFIAEDPFDRDALTSTSPHARAVAALRERLLPDARSLVWLRTCEAFGAGAGLDFAERLAGGLGARVAGHTYIIGALQSGCRALAPGQRPTWSALEGLAEGTAEKPVRAHESSPRAPRTLHFLSNEVRAGWFAEDGRAG